MKGGRVPGRDERAPARASRAPGSRRSAPAGTERRHPVRDARRDRGRGARSPACSAGPTRLTAPASTRRDSCAGSRDACERRGVIDLRALPAIAIAPGRVTCAHGERARRDRRAGDGGVHDAATRRAPHATSRWPRTCSRPSRCRPRAWARSAGRAARRSPISATSSSTPSGRRTTGSRSAAAGSPIALGGADPRADEVQPAIHGWLEQTLRRLFPAAAASAGHPSLGRLLRRAPRLEHERRLRPRDRPRTRRRLLGPRRRRVEPRRPHARRPDHRNRERPHRPALGRPREPPLGAGAAPLSSAARTIAAVARERRRGGGSDGAAGPAGSRLVQRWLPGR